MLKRDFCRISRGSASSPAIAHHNLQSYIFKANELAFQMYVGNILAKLAI